MSEARIIFKILLLTFKIFHGNAPIYLRDLLDLHVLARNLRSSDKLCLTQPRGNFNKIYGQRAFSVCAPVLWNDLPFKIKTARSVDSFKRNLKTYLYTQFHA